MQAPEIPSNEKERIKALRNLNLLDTPIEETFERITRLTKALFDVPIVSFTLIDSERQWFKSIQGQDVCETSREISFCGHTINQDDIFVVNDALEDARFADNPLVTFEPKIRFYAGCPVRTKEGYKIGSLCIIDTTPRKFTDAQLALLKDMVALTESEMIANKLSLNHSKLIQELDFASIQSQVDCLTRLWNRSGIENILKNRIERANATHKNFSIAMVDIDNFKKINDSYGHLAGDEILRTVAKRLLAGYRKTDSVGRWGGEEFLIITDHENPKQFFDVADRARHKIAEEPVQLQNNSIKPSVTTGLAQYDHKHPCDLATLMGLADAALYYGKNHGKNIVVDAADEISPAKSEIR